MNIINTALIIRNLKCKIVSISTQSVLKEMSFKSQAKSAGNFRIAKGAVVCTEALLIGDITIGSQTVVQPSAKILAEGGPIVIGDGNLIQEQVTIINKKTDDDEQKTLEIGNGNVFEVGAYCESRSIGNGNTLESKSRVGSNTSISERCVVGAACEINSMETLPPDTIIYGSDCRRYTKKTILQTTNQQQLEYLIKVLPNYHHLTKSTAA